MGPQRDERHSQEHDGGDEQATFGTERATGPELRAALFCGQESRAERSEAADREAVDCALEEVPGDMQTYGDRQFPGEHVAEAEHQAGEDNVERAYGRGVRVAGV